MPKLFAFLRAINVGGRNIKMDQLRELFTQIGFDRVETFIASGNVIFEAPPDDPLALEARIETGLRAALGYEVATFVRTVDEVADIVQRVPFDPSDLLPKSHTLYVSLIKRVPDSAAEQRLLALSTDLDEFHVDGSAVYWLLRRENGESKFTNGKLEKALGMPATRRNMQTFTRMLAKYG
jgi:uncharacterized protein (DUF1697 family)